MDITRPNWLYSFRVVYHDGRYPTKWIQQSNPAVIANYLERNGFIKVNADMLRDWVELQLKNRTASKAVVVMSQDVAPDTVFEVTRSDCMFRKFLDAGGRIVWIGDVPFFYRGHLKIVPVEAKIPGGSEDDLGLVGQLAVLGSFSSLITPKDQVTISREGLRRGIQTKWPSERPVRLKFLGRKPVVLARPPTPQRIRPEDVTPEQADSGEKSSAAARIIESGQLLGAATSVGAALALVLGLVLSFVDSESIPLTSQRVVSTLLYASVTVILLITGIRTWLRNRFVSAWIARYGEKGEFVRLWDYSNPQIDSSMLSELLRVSTFGR